MTRETPPRALGVIPARWGSTRLPGKSLVPLCGKPLIRWVVERAARAARLDAVLVATDDARIAEAVAGLDAVAVMTRADHPSGTDRVAEAVAGRGADLVVNIQGDEPLIDPRLIDRLVETLAAQEQWEMATAAAPVESRAALANPSVVKVVTGADGRALYFSRAAIPYLRDRPAGSDLSLYRRHLGIYAYRAHCLERLVAAPPCGLERAEKLEQLRALHLGVAMVVLDADDPGIGVDTPEDVAYAEQRIREMQARSPDGPCDDGTSD